MSEMNFEYYDGDDFLHDNYIDILHVNYINSDHVQYNDDNDFLYENEHYLYDGHVDDHNSDPESNDDHDYNGPEDN